MAEQAGGKAEVTCPACGATHSGLTTRLPLVARLDPLARAVASPGEYRCPDCGHRWPEDPVPVA